MEDFRCVVEDVDEIRAGLTSDDDTGSVMGIGGTGCLTCIGMFSSDVGRSISEN